MYLLFSMVSGGYFSGVAKMASMPSKELFFTRWLQYQIWRGLFRVDWLLAKDVPNKSLTHLENR